MKRFVLDTARLDGVLCVTAPARQMEFNSDAPKLDARTGLPVWLVGISLRWIDERKASVVECKVIADAAPVVSVGDVLTVEGLEASLWEANGRSGVTFKAASILKATTPATATTGTAASGSAPVGNGAAGSSGSPGATRSGKGGEG